MCAPTWVSVIGIVGTWVIAIAAIWGDRIRAFLLRPRLELRVLSPAGEFLNVSERRSDGVVFAPTREFYVRVTNARHHPVVNDVEVLLTRIEYVGPNGLPQHAYGGASSVTLAASRVLFVPAQDWSDHRSGRVVASTAADSIYVHP